ncbi:MAG: hypothetical protein ACE5FG_08635 [Myxococcota bacterium]
MRRSSARSWARIGLLAGVALGVSAGCGKMLEGPTQTVRLHCSPSDEIEIVIDGQRHAFQEGRVELSKKRESHFITLEREGYQPTTIAFDREINPLWPVLDLLWGPGVPVAWFVDWWTGSLFRIDPRELHVVLRRKEENGN